MYCRTRRLKEGVKQLLAEVTYITNLNDVHDINLECVMPFLVCTMCRILI